MGGGQVRDPVRQRRPDDPVLGGARRTWLRPGPARIHRRCSPGRPGSRSRHPAPSFVPFACHVLARRGPAVSWPGRRPAPGFTTRVPDFEAFFEALPAPCIVFAADDPRYTIVAVNEAYLARHEQRALRRARPPRPAAVPDLSRSAVRSRGDGDGEHADLAAPRDAAPRAGPHERAALRRATADGTRGGAATGVP